MYYNNLVMSSVVIGCCCLIEVNYYLYNLNTIEYFILHVCCLALIGCIILGISRSSIYEDIVLLALTSLHNVGG